MLFNSFEFILFLPLVVILFYSIPHTSRSLFILIASYTFYMSWNPWYLILLLISTLSDYYIAIQVDLVNRKWKKQILVLSSLLINLGILAFFKYGDFIIENYNWIMHSIGKEHRVLDSINLLLPVGISFYTFQTISYTIDVYRGKITPERNLLKFSLYVCYFPQLVAGPIERYKKLGTELAKKVNLDTNNIRLGTLYIMSGFFYKMVISDNIGWVIDEAYLINNIEHNYLFIILLYPLQIYCDFHGYSTIAIGVARLMGVRLSYNFQGPFWSTSMTDFWRKWHISLTSWFRDYVYYPIGGNKRGTAIMFIGVLIVFLLSGFWHGANWTFIIWGALNGIKVLEEKIRGKNFRLPSSFVADIFNGAIIFSFTAIFFVFFRAQTIDHGLAIINSLTHKNILVPELSIIVVILIIVFLFIDYKTRNSSFAFWLNEQKPIFQWSIGGILLFCIMSLSGTNQQPFIYFQF